MRLSFRTRGMSSQRKLHPDLIVGVQDVFSGGLSMPSVSAHVTALLGLHYNRSFHRDPAFLLLLALGPIVWFFMVGFLASYSLPRHAIWSPAFVSITLWQPLFEELLFRGIVQGYLLQSMARQKTWFGLSISNLLTSFLFSLAHLVNHSILWSLLVFVPSLGFGFVRDRFGSVYPSIALHAFYNAGYFLLIGSATLLNSR